MKRSEIRSLIESGVTLLNNANAQIGFDSGRITEFNSTRSNEYPYVWLESLETDPDLTDTGLPIDNWQINLHICKKDAMDSTPKQYEDIIDECDFIAQKLIYRYNNIIKGLNTATISGYSRVPFIKKHADCLTGVLLSFVLNVPDKTSMC